ncbi:MAG: hypothetical protein PVI97_15985 [Candidatus Thiodiazotropha sp.]|jgi:hypothetical protein
MITLNAAYARIKRQKIEEFAGDCFLHRDDVIEKIPDLQAYKNQQFLFGIYYSETKWIVLSVNYLYAAYESDLTILRLDTETDKIYNYFKINDFSSDIHLKDGRRIWMKSPDLSSLVLNVMLMLQKIPCGTVLE